jgi:hypothetical protein
MDLYEVMEPGFYSPLSSREISQLFRAGHLDREAACKAVGEGRWRTIDELFPLLRYQSQATLFESEDPRREPGRPPIALIGVVIALVLIAGAIFLWNKGALITTSRTASTPTAPAMLPVVDRFTPVPHFATEQWPMIRRDPTANIARLIAEKRQREETAREQAANADRMRANNERQRQEAAKAAGTDYHVALDRNQYIAMPGGGVWVKVHDNDVTSFDISINSGQWREVPKQKGISHSGTDEAFVYNNGRASLYYVWEIAGELNHCLLRVREN